jgi:hypothetical protein
MNDVQLHVGRMTGDGSGRIERLKPLVVLAKPCSNI